MPITTTASNLEGSQVPDPTDSPAHHTGTPPSPLPPLLNIPFVGTPTVGCPFAGFIVSPMQKKWVHSHSSILGVLSHKWTCVDSKKIEVRSDHSSIQVEDDMPTLALEAGLCSEPQEQEPTSPPSSPTKVTADPDDGTVVEMSRSTGDQNSESSTNQSGTSSN